MIVNIVVAASDNNVIGKNNKLLWDLPNDTAFFKNITYGMPVIMGRKTMESLGKPLKGRVNIVITRNPARLELPAGVLKVETLEKALKEAEDTDALECSVIGGGEIYRQAMGIATRIYRTRVRGIFEGDTFFPEIDLNIWRMVHCVSFETDERHKYAYQFETWERL